MALRTLGVCAGIGGLELGLRPFCRTVGLVERDSFAAATLVARMEDASLDRAPIWDDVRTFDARAWAGCVDLVAGGYPCQPFSVAGKRRGEEDERHLWPFVHRILVDSGAPLGFFENVAGHVTLGLEEVLDTLSASGFDAEWSTIRAADVGAPHRRDRLFILAYAHGEGLRLLRECAPLDLERAPLGYDADRRSQALADAELARRPRDLRGELAHRQLDARHLAGQGRGAAAWPPPPDDLDGWARWLAAGGAEPALRRGTDGSFQGLESALAFRRERLRCLGNAVVPQQATAAFVGLVRRVLC